MGKDWGKMHRQTVTLQGGSSFVVLAFFTVVASSPNLSTLFDFGCKVTTFCAYSGAKNPKFIQTNLALRQLEQLEQTWQNVR